MRLAVRYPKGAARACASASMGWTLYSIGLTRNLIRTRVRSKPFGGFLSTQAYQANERIEQTGVNHDDHDP